MMPHDLPGTGPPQKTLNPLVVPAVIPFSLDFPEEFTAVVEVFMTRLDSRVRILGLGEALHGGEEILLLRNRLFRHLVEHHGYTAIAIESSLPRSRLVNEYVTGSGAASYDDLLESGFSHGFGRLDANRELVEWMRLYNADLSHPVKIRFYGFDSPMEMMFTDSPRTLLHGVLAYLVSVDPDTGREFMDRIDPLIGRDADWENPAAMMDPDTSIGLSPAASALRIETGELITHLHITRPGLVAAGGESRYLQAFHDAGMARDLLIYHAGVARRSKRRVARLLGIRDAMMADNLVYIAICEQDRGKVLVYAHNSHLTCGISLWQLGPDLNTWWTAGSHLRERVGHAYAVIGSGVGVSEENGIGDPEPGTLEASLAVTPGPVRFVPANAVRGSVPEGVTDIPVRSGGSRNTTYFPLTGNTLSGFDWLVFFDSVSYNRGGPPLGS